MSDKILTSIMDDIRLTIVLWVLEFSLWICPKHSDNYRHLLIAVNEYSQKELYQALREREDNDQ